MTPIEEALATHSVQIGRLADMAETLGQTQTKHAGVSLAHDNEMAVTRAVLAALVATHPNKPLLHLAIQKAWDEGRGTLGVPGMPDGATENARAILKMIGDILGKPIL